VGEMNNKQYIVLAQHLITGQMIWTVEPNREIAERNMKGHINAGFNVDIAEFHGFLEV